MLKLKKGYHRHHIVPRHAGGSDSDSNIVYLTKEEHAQAHWELYEKYGRDQDRRAALLIENGGDLETPEFKQWRKENNIKAAAQAHEAKLKNGFYKKLGKLNSKRMKGVPNPDHSDKMKKAHKENPMYWWNNGVDQKRASICPGPKWTRGRINTGSSSDSLKETFKTPYLWWNNGIKNTRNPVCPGPEWTRGKI